MSTSAIRSTCCSRMASGVINGAKNFSLGAAAVALLTPIDFGANFFLNKMSQFSSTDTIGQQVKVWREWGLKIDGERIRTAACPLQEFVTQYNNQIPRSFHQSVLALKISSIVQVAVLAPIFEEIVFRGIIQSFLLKQIPSYIIKKCAPGKESYLDSSIAKIARITITTGLFVAVHIPNRMLMSENYVNGQLVTALITGIGFGYLRESKVGLLGAIGAHFAKNFLPAVPVLMSC